MSLPPPVRLVGCGSSFGDDAVGWTIIATLRAALADVPGIESYTLSAPDRLLDVLDGSGSLVLVDGLLSGAPPGSVLRFDWPDPRLRCLMGPSTHGLPVTSMLEVAARLGNLPPRVVVFGVECEMGDPAAALSPVVAAAVPTAVQAILAEIGVPSSAVTGC